MELFFRIFYHKFMTIVYTLSGFKNYDTYKYNIKRIDSIIEKDYGSVIGEEFSGESEGSCSVVSKDVSSHESVTGSNEFELPNKSEEVQSRQNSEGKSNEN